MSINNHFTSHIHQQIQTQTSCRRSKHYTMMQQDSPSKALSSNNSSISCNNNNNQQQQKCEIPKEPLFEKSLTPSDVGKLNRLVIPKQHAERYFPMNVGRESDEKGSLLSFEDEVGKAWRFRYSYWNSSQSYVLTKGWSRFVKEKRLDAGDVVVFLRHRVEPGCHFIGWRRRNSGGGGDAVLTSTGNGYPVQQCGYAGSVLSNQTTIRNGSNSTRMLRLFGVNLECELAVGDECDEPPSSTMSSQGQAYHYYPYHQC